MDFLHLLEGLRTPFGNTVFQFLTTFGEETLFLVVALIIFWCVDKRSGYFLMYVSFFGAIVNQFCKLLFCIPRPWVRDPSLTIVESARSAATGYSFPSGHTQSAGGLFFGIARYGKTKWLRILCIVMAALVGFSRMYLGVHTPADVGVSLLISLALVLAAYPLFRRAWNGSPKAYVPLLFGLLAAGIALVVYAEFCPAPANAIPENTIHGCETAYKMLGASVGIALAIPLETKYIRFDTKAVWWAQVLKVALGVILVVGVRTLTKAPLLALCGGHYMAGFLRYFLMVMAGGLLWPLTFRYFARLGRVAAA